MNRRKNKTKQKTKNLLQSFGAYCSFWLTFCTRREGSFQPYNFRQGISWASLNNVMKLPLNSLCHNPMCQTNPSTRWKLTISYANDFVPHRQRAAESWGLRHLADSASKNSLAIFCLSNSLSLQKHFCVLTISQVCASALRMCWTLVRASLKGFGCITCCVIVFSMEVGDYFLSVSLVHSITLL